MVANIQKNMEYAIIFQQKNTNIKKSLYICTQSNTRKTNAYDFPILI